MGSRVYPRPSASAEDTGAEWLKLELVVAPACDGYRLDRFLDVRIKRMSRTRIQSLVADGRVYRPGRSTAPMKASTRVRAGETLVLVRPAPIEPPGVLDYEVVHEDDDLLVIAKPAGLTVHPSARYHRHTLTALMRERLGPHHPWVMAHRLDRETSGVMVFGRRGTSSRVVKTAFQHRRVVKDYLAIVRGLVHEPTRIELPIGPALASRIRIKVGPRALDDGGVDALTLVTPIAHGRHRGGDVTLVNARPLTGRQHQIRVHLAAMNHPIVGDKLYAADEELVLDVLERGRPMTDLEERVGLNRQALHAATVELDHPRTGERVRFAASWPAELAAIVSPQGW